MNELNRGNLDRSKTNNDFGQIKKIASGAAVALIILFGAKKCGETQFLDDISNKNVYVEVPNEAWSNNEWIYNGSSLKTSFNIRHYRWASELGLDDYNIYVDKLGDWNYYCRMTVKDENNFYYENLAECKKTDIDDIPKWVASVIGKNQGDGIEDTSLSKIEKATQQWVDSLKSRWTTPGKYVFYLE